MPRRILRKARQPKRHRHSRVLLHHRWRRYSRDEYGHERILYREDRRVHVGPVVERRESPRESVDAAEEIARDSPEHIPSQRTADRTHPGGNALTRTDEEVEDGSVARRASSGRA